MNLSIFEITKYIKNFFHQYMDITLNFECESNQKVNVIIPLSDLYSTNSAYSILSKYPDTSIPKEKEVYCTDVIDGDTIWVKDVIKKDPQTGEISLGDNAYKIRFIGIDAPETTENISKKSIEFVKQCCFKKFLYINVDNERKYDNYGRTRAIVIAYNKNLNEILLKERLATLMYITPTEFDSREWNTGLVDTTFNPSDTNDLSDLSLFINNDFNNVVFTPVDNYDTVYSYEFYKGVYYIKANPYSKKIRMHILPRHYDCSNTVLFLKDNMKDKLTITKKGNYKVYEDRNTINAYFQENGIDRDRNGIQNRDYNINDWTGSNETYIDFSYDVSNDTKNFEDLEICVGYKYNKTSPFYAIHYTGVKDNTNKQIDDRATLLDVNVDEVNTYTNAITQMAYNSNSNPKIYIKHDVKNNIKKNLGNIDHIDDINALRHKKIKYINDSIYVEEETVHGFHPWTDPVD